MDPSQNNAKQQIVDRLKEATNVLVTVSANPSVDQLSAAIGLTLLLNKLGKHGTAVFSGEPPSTLEFLQPEKTLEKTTDSLRDFIISLDKAKADKLRYKVEEKVVKIFITPYRVSLSKDDLEFSQGDFNVDVVIGLGVQQREELDQAIAGQARILHDATVISINNNPGANLGSINWFDTEASSLCEMLVYLGEAIKPEFLDAQMATAFLTGVVAETDRFSNDKTTPRAMTIAGRLMTAGANQQLIATKLEEPEQPSAPEPQPPLPPNLDGTDVPLASPPDAMPESAPEAAPAEPEPPAEEPTQEEEARDSIHIDEHGTVRRIEELQAEQELKAAAQNEAQPAQTDDNKTEVEQERHFIEEPPATGDDLLGVIPPDEMSGEDPLSLPPVSTDDQPVLSHAAPLAAPPPPAYTPPPQSPPADTQTLHEIEETVHSPHILEEKQLEEPPTLSTSDRTLDVSNARGAVENAIASSFDEARDDQGATPVNLDLGHQDLEQEPLQSPPEPAGQFANGTPQFDLPPPPGNLVSPLTGLPVEEPGRTDRSNQSTPPLPPPPIPPPMPFQNQDDSLASSSQPFTMPPMQ